jgi:hypothetical protein
VHDAVQIERLGVPAVVVITEPFRDLVRTFSGSIGMPDYPAVVLPHPVSSKADDELRTLAAKAVDEVVRLLSAF